VSLDGIKGFPAIFDDLEPPPSTGFMLLEDGVGYLLLENGGKIGVASGPDVGRAPRVMMRYSDDGGAKWSNERAASLGLVGNRQQRTIWTALGRMQSPGRIFEFRITDAAKVVVNGVRINEAFA
jgi:hypothetical protein